MSSPVRDALQAIESAGQKRRLRQLQSAQGAHVTFDGRRLVNFSSNDTLGLAAAPELRRAAVAALDSHGHGAGSARLLSGNFELATQLENDLADWLHAEACLLFSSGYHANLGVISTLATSAHHLFSDRDNHASIIDGIRLGRAAKTIYPHLAPTIADLRPDDLLVTESVFSMEGKRLPPSLIADVQAQGARAIVDEAHAIGWAGDGGRGLAPNAFCRIGTLGKALGSYGAFVLGSSELVDLLRSSARAFIFTTALPAPVLGASLAAVELCRGNRGDELRQRLQRNVETLGLSETPICTVAVGDSARAVSLSAAFEERGLLVQAIRPPTVPIGAACLRIVVTAAHSTDDVEMLLRAIDDLIERP